MAAKQGHRSSSTSKSSYRLQSSRHRKPSSSIHKIFAFGSLFTRQDSHHWKSQNFDYDNVSPSPEESFISIKFEENGVASWEKSTVSNKVPLEKCNSNNNKVSLNNENNKDKSTNNKSVIEHGKSRDSFRWRKRIGHMFQLIRWKKSGGVCHVASTKVEGVKVRKGWMRTLTKRKTTME